MAILLSSRNLLPHCLKLNSLLCLMILPNATFIAQLIRPLQHIEFGLVVEKLGACPPVLPGLSLNSVFTIICQHSAANTFSKLKIIFDVQSCIHDYDLSFILTSIEDFSAYFGYGYDCCMSLKAFIQKLF